MIFVTVGTTYKFDSLLKSIDRIAPRLKEKVIAQTGRSDYKPKNCEHFDFRPSLNDYMRQASLVIAHGGAGTTYEALCMGKKLVSVENPNVNDSHQWDLLQKLSDEGYLIWCKDIDKLEQDIALARRFRFRKYKSPRCEIGKKIAAEMGA